MHELDLHDFAEFYKAYSAYQAAQTSKGDEEDNPIKANATQLNDSDQEQDLFAVLQAEHQNNQQQQATTSNKLPPLGDIKQLLSSTTKRNNPFG